MLKEKSFICALVVVKAFGRVPRKVFESMMRKKMSQVTIGRVMSLHEGAKTRIIENIEL